MKRNFSVYLDLVRLLSASSVFVAHLTFPRFTGGYFSYQGKLAAEGVAAFFVLSGYVIAYVADAKERTAKAYAISRLARIYSVALPAIALAIVVGFLSVHYGWRLNVPLYQLRQWPKYFLLALTFSGHLGPLQESAFGNYAFWSLDYEVWYYITFGCFIFLAGSRKYLIVALLLLLMGPRPLIDFPMWLLGVGTYQLHKRVDRAMPLAFVLFFGSLVLLVTYRLSGLDAAVDDWVNGALNGWPRRSLGDSQEFASQYLAACLVAMSILSAGYMRLVFFEQRSVASTITWLASFTFTLYLTQLSLLELLSHLFRYNPHAPPYVVFLVAATLLSVWLLGQLTEHRKQWWRKFFRMIIDSAEGVLRRT